MGLSLKNRSLDRGLTILRCLSIHGASSLRDLHARTALPKSTIRRLLGTLVQRKIVRRSLNDELYRSNITLPVQSNSRSQPADGLLVDCAVSHMIELTHAIGWSCDLHIFERSHSRVIESTRPLSPFYQYDRQIDFEVPVFSSAASLAVLSTFSEQAVLRLVGEIGDHPRFGLNSLGITKRSLLKGLQAARANGFAVRALEFRSNNVYSNKLHAIARPVYRGDVPVGALVILWPKGFLSTEQFAKIYLPGFSETASAISTDLARINF